MDRRKFIKCNDIFVVADSAHGIGILDIAVKQL